MYFISSLLDLVLCKSGIRCLDKALSRCAHLRFVDFATSSHVWDRSEWWKQSNLQTKSQKIDPKRSDVKKVFKKACSECAGCLNDGERPSNTVLIQQKMFKQGNRICDVFMQFLKYCDSCMRHYFPLNLSAISFSPSVGSLLETSG